MQCSLLLTGLALVFTRVGQSQALPPDTARLRQHLPEVAIRAQHKFHTLSAPGELRGLHTAFGRELPPLAGVAVWHGPPDTTRLYRVTAIRVRLGTRLPQGTTDLLKERRNFSAGRLQLTLCRGTLATGPQEAQNLLANPLIALPETAADRHGWLHFDVTDQEILLPAQGLFVVAEGLTSSPQETFVRHRSLARPLDGHQSPEDVDFKKQGKATEKGTTVFRYEELRLADGSTHLVETQRFPAVAYRLVDTPGACYSWVRIRVNNQLPFWRALREQQADARRYSPTHKFYDHNYELELVVEEL